MKSLIFNCLVLGRPFPNLNTLINKKGTENRFADGKLFYPRGRDALIAGIKYLGLKVGDCIIIPAFMCESTVTPLRKAGYEVIFLDINEDLNFDITELKKLALKYKASAILAVNYFGFSCNLKEVSELCLFLKIKLIEDCSHSFLSPNNFSGENKHSDIIIYSLRKTLPIRDGGVLKIKGYTKDDSIDLTNQVAKIYFSDFIYLFSRVVEYMVSQIGWPNIYSNSVEYLKNSIRAIVLNRKKLDDHKIVNSEKPSIMLSRYISNTKYLERTRNKLVENYLTVTTSAYQLGFELKYADLPHNTVPQWAVLRDQRGYLVDQLRSKGIGACRWPGNELISEVNKFPDKYQNAKRLNNELVLIPIHQSLGEKDLKKIISSLKKFSYKY